MTEVRAARFEGQAVIRCTPQDEYLSRLVMGAGLFFERAVPPEILEPALAIALGPFAIFAGRLGGEPGRRTIEVANQGARFSVRDDPRTLEEVFRAVGLRRYDGLLDPIDPRAAQRGAAPLLSVRVCALAGGAMTIGCSWQHAVGDMASFMALLRGWSAAARGEPVVPPVVVLDRRDHLYRQLPDPVATPGVRRLGWWEAARLAGLMATHARTHRLVRVYFSDAELGRMRSTYAGDGAPLFTNEVLCAHMVEQIRRLEPDFGPRTLGLAINFRQRVGLPAELLGNMVSDLRLISPPGEAPQSFARRLRAAVDRFGEEHLDAVVTSRYLESLSPSAWRRCVPLSMDPLRRVLMLSNVSGFGVYDLDFGAGRPSYFTSLTRAPVPWLGGIVEGFGGRGRLFGAYLPRRIDEALASPRGRAQLHMFRDGGEVDPELSRQIQVR
jgi:hypothetical protein